MSMFNKGNGEKVARLPNPRHDQVNGLLDKGCTFEGKLTFDGTVQINGDFQGEIYSDGTLVIGTNAQVRAKIFVDTLIVYGKIDGDIEAKSRIEMHVPAVISANLKTKHLSVEDGVIFQGSCQMERQPEPARLSSDFGARSSEEGFLDRNVSDDSDNVLVV
ncbi:MAG: polymer-forming cytoskeletal protein [Deltaproteobacteria bacterium]|nr:polymer-forming cytoskeletal protein [Deltaproteobacteria bacterium]